MQFIKPRGLDDLHRPVRVSMAAVLLAAGAPGKRFALPHSRVLIHQPWGGTQGQVTDIEIQAKEMLRMRDELDEILAKHTGQTVEKIHADTERDNIMMAERGQGVRPGGRRPREPQGHGRQVA